MLHVFISVALNDRASGKNFRTYEILLLYVNVKGHIVFVLRASEGPI